MNQYKSMNRLFLAMVVTYLLGVNVVYYFCWNYLESDYTLTAVCEFFAILVPCIYAVVKRYDSVEDLGFRPLKSEAVLPIIITALLLLPLVTFVSLLSQLFVTGVGEEIADTMAQGSFGVNFVFIAIVPAMIEETIFRGVLYQQYRKHGILVAMFFTAFLFGFFHMNFNQFFYAVIASIFFTFLVEATGSVWASVIAHMTINGFQVIEQAAYQYESAHVTEEEFAEAMQIATDASEGNALLLTYVICGVLAVVCTYGAIRMVKRICNICDRHFTMAQLLDTDAVRKVTIPLILGVGICLAYMIRYEMLT